MPPGFRDLLAIHRGGPSAQPENVIGFFDLLAIHRGGPSHILISPPVFDSASAVQRDATRTWLVDVQFAVHDPNDTDLTLTVEWSLGPSGPWATATPQPFDRHHTADNPLTGVASTGPPGTPFWFVWRAFDDLPEGVFEDVHLRLRVVDDEVGSDEVVVGPIVVSTVEVAEDDPLARALARRAEIARTPVDFLGHGLVLPFERASRDFASATGVELVRACVRVIFSCRAAVGEHPGDLPWRPDFGQKFWVLRHRNNSPSLREEAKAYAMEALRWEPRAQVTEVFVEQPPHAGPNELRLRIRYKVIPEQVPDNRVFLPEFEEVVPLG